MFYTTQQRVCCGLVGRYEVICPEQGKWTNKERVLIFSSRGINFRTRHLMQDLRTMMPHSKAGKHSHGALFSTRICMDN